MSQQSSRDELPIKILTRIHNNAFFFLKLYRWIQRNNARNWVNNNNSTEISVKLPLGSLITKVDVAILVSRCRHLLVKSNNSKHCRFFLICVCALFTVLSMLHSAGLIFVSMLIVSDFLWSAGHMFFWHWWTLNSMLLSKVYSSLNFLGVRVSFRKPLSTTFGKTIFFVMF